MGLANDKSIAWGIAEALHAEGAEIGVTYVGEAMKKRVLPLAEQLNARRGPGLYRRFDEASKRGMGPDRLYRARHWFFR